MLKKGRTPLSGVRCVREVGGLALVLAVELREADAAPPPNTCGHCPAHSHVATIRVLLKQISLFTIQQIFTKHLLGDRHYFICLTRLVKILASMKPVL